MAEKGTSVFKHRTFCVVTGASKGLGRCMAIRFASLLAKNSVLLLIARSEDHLLSTKALIEANTRDIKVKVAGLDLGCQDRYSFERVLKETLSDFTLKQSDFEQAMIIHNAASLGDVSKRLTQFDDVAELSEYFDVNLTSVVALNSVFLRLFTDSMVTNQLVVNTSSICALQPFKTWSLYCAAKACRDMLFRTMALEEPSIRVLNYAPGPVDTNMQLEARTVTGDKELKSLFADMHASSKLLSCDQSVDKLIRLLEANTFDSGAHIDYYDF